VTKEPLDVNEVIREMEILLKNEAIQHSVSVQTKLTADLPLIAADRIQLQQVLMNLMINSIDAMKAVDGPRQLTLGTQNDSDEQLLVSVEDTGVGLPPGTKLARYLTLFLPPRNKAPAWDFVSAERSLRPTAAGCGLRTTSLAEQVFISL
jgi:C4-dicarboxylate-specific signal transduction histidine kinase